MNATSYNVYYSIICQSDEQPYFKYYHTFSDLIDHLYNHLLWIPIDKLQEVHVCVYYKGVCITNYQLEYNNALYLVDKESRIKIVSIYPEIAILDNIIGKKIGKNNPTKKNIIKKKLIKKNNIIKPENSTRLENKIEPIKEENSDDNKQKIDCIINGINTIEIKNYVSNKDIYKKIRIDVNNNNIEEDRISPDFIMIYDIFKILEGRNCINLDNDLNVIDEYKNFKDLYDIYLSDAEESCIYMPPNYDSLNDSQKEEYASKYNMTKNEIESLRFNN